MKRFHVLLVIVILILSVTTFRETTALASCVNGTTDVLDNDNNALNSSDNTIVGPWIHKDAANSFRGDQRYLATPPSTGNFYEYDWRFPSCTGLYSNVYVYLWDTAFVNEKADYRIYNFSSSPATLTMNLYLNQRTAPGGWNFVGKTSQAKTGVLALLAFSDMNGITGADGAKVIYSAN